MPKGEYALYTKKHWRQNESFLENVARISRRWHAKQHRGGANGPLNPAADKRAADARVRAHRQRVARAANAARAPAPAAPAAAPAAPAAPQAPVPQGPMPVLGMAGWPQLLPPVTPPKAAPQKPQQPPKAPKPAWQPKPPKGQQQGPGRKRAPVKKKKQQGGIRGNYDMVTGNFIPPARKPWGLAV